MTVRIGADENGLGPLLGPLIVTAIAARVSDDTSARMTKEPHAFLSKRLADSKKLVAHGDVNLGEAWARTITNIHSNPA
ncbi:MAG: hypothetical protein FWD57_13815, partial [Polyangiaceae bacterium]|nr:hypothetical protein [Polyangiaceae bacterium]